MHDVIHASIANQRVRDLVESGERQRTVREVERRRRAAAKTVTRRAERAGVTTALLRLYRGVI